MKWMFKEDHSLEHRCVESAKIRAKYPDRVPVIVEKVSGSQIVDIDKRKYLVPSDITVAQFMWIIRKRIQLPSEKAIFLFVDKTVPQSRSWRKQMWAKQYSQHVCRCLHNHIPPVGFHWSKGLTTELPEASPMLSLRVKLISTMSDSQGLGNGSSQRQAGHIKYMFTTPGATKYPDTLNTISAQYILAKSM
ncbi:gamma-aminobutyric acid receptor-associated protein-like 2 isoform X1 [Cricetulus griseus]|uniref:gamma-aminobutyric acid receptor-associated protein-like 2 isoform X1 n=1 Tax=Cricetulus griseus TaxID=10029 RepID=UPI0015C30FBD|nr:gamma-aminobutyric acid receptor-associated protein-like 2 isoform X1 [Cricetulus griseus]